MRDAVNQVRADLAFLRVVAEDRGALPALMGWHLAAIGGIFALAFVHIWAVYAGHAPWPETWMHLLFMPGLIVYTPINLWLGRKARNFAWGPGATVFGAAWAAMATMIPPTLAVFFLAQAQTGHPFYQTWPALAFVFYGGAWMLAAIVRRRACHAAVALGCFAVALWCAVLVRSDFQWLIMAGGLATLVAMPGLAIVRRARFG